MREAVRDYLCWFIGVGCLFMFGPDPWLVFSIAAFMAMFITIPDGED
jgi:hypothetical protein